MWPLSACRYASFRIQNIDEIGQSVDELWPKKRISRWRRRPPPSWIPKISIFGDVTITGFNIWCSVQNFIKIGQFFTKMWRFNEFQNGGRPPSWVLHICIFCPVALVSMPFCFLIQNFAKIGQLVDDLWPKKRFSRWRPPPSWIFEISIFGHESVTGFNIWSSVPNFIKIWRFFTEIWWFSDLQDGGRPPSWICYDVTILHRRTHFRCPNIVLKYHVDRCCSFRDNCNRKSAFWLYITDHSNCGVAHALYHVTSGATTGGNGGSRLRAPLERGRRVQTAMFFILFNYKITFCGCQWHCTQYTSPNTPMLYR